MKQQNSDHVTGEDLDQISEPRRQRRYLVIGSSVVALILLVIVVALWKWRSSST
jgi:hypothetical protein